MKRRGCLLAPCLGGLALAGLPALPAAAQTLTQVGTIANFAGTASMLEISDNGFTGTPSQTNYSSAFALSGDGSTLVGDSVTAAGVGHAFSFSGGGINDLGALAPGGASVAMGVNGNGSVIVGFSEIAGGTWHAFRYAGGAMADLGTLVNGSAGYSFATGTSADGSVVVGATYTNTSIDHAFRWTAGGGMTDLGTFPGVVGGYSDAYGVSADGNTVVGWSTSASGAQQAFRWTNGGGMINLGTIGGAPGTSLARAADADGGVVVGYSATPSGASHAFRWQGGNMADLGTIGGGLGNSNALAVNADGSIVAGSSAVGGAMHAFLWTQASSMQDLNALLAAGGVNMTGVTLTRASGLSSDGSMIGGSGTFPNTGGNTQAFLARVVPSNNPNVPGIVGVTTPSSVLASINALAASQQAQIITKNTLASLLTGRNQQVNCSSCVSGFGSAGSLSGGVSGRYAITPELTALGGISYGEYTDSQGDVHVTDSTTLAGSLRYDLVDWGWSRPFGELGAVVTPTESTQLSRSYMNGAGTATGVGQTSDHSAAAFGRVGWVFRLSPRDEVAAIAGVSRSWQTAAAYAEPIGPSNPFPATSSGGTDIMNTASLGAQYTRLLTDTIEGNINAGVDRSFGSKNGITMTIAGVGSSSPSPGENTWYEYGVRVGYRATQALTVDLFIDGTSGPGAIGNQVHGGIGLRFSY